MQLSRTPPSAAEFKALYDETGWGDRTLAEIGSALANTWLFCTTRDADGRVTGMGRLISDGVLHAFVTEIIVREGARGRGVGAQILACLVGETHARGVDDVQLFAASGRAAFYERNGFTRRPEHAPGMDAGAPGVRPG